MSNDFIKALSDTRKMYREFISIMDDERASVEERWEASELVKDGFYPFVYKMMQITSGEGGKSYD